MRHFLALSLILSLAAAGAYAASHNQGRERFVNNQAEVITADKTYHRNDTDSVIIADAADLTATLPLTEEGLKFTFCLGTSGLSAGTGLSISPQAADEILGNGLTSVADKDLILAGATDREGDCVTLVADGADGWMIASVTGTWSKEA